MIDRYFERFPGINRYIAETLSSVREKGFTETLFGRKTHFPRIASRNQSERQGAERAAINAPIQGTSADIIKRAMVRMEPALAAAGLGHVRMLLQVHDELVFEAPEADAEAAGAVIRDVMAGAAEPAVSLSVPWASRSASARAGARRIDPRRHAPLMAQSQDIDALAKGGRTNIAGFILRLAARIPSCSSREGFTAPIWSGASPSRWWWSNSPR